MEGAVKNRSDELKRDVKMFFALLKRGLKIFLSDKMSVFFSLLAPLIILMLYVLFLSDIQMDSIESAMAGLPIDHDVLRGIVDGWMLAGVFRNVFTRGAMAEVEKLSPIAADAVRSHFSMSMDAFGKTIHSGDMWLILALFCVALAIALSALYFASSRSSDFLNIFVRRKNKHKK